MNYGSEAIVHSLVLLQYLQIRAASTTVDAVETLFATTWGTVGECASAGMALLETASTVLVSTIQLQLQLQYTFV